MQRSVNLVEGNTLELECEPWGLPKPTVSWRRGSGALNWSDPRIITMDNETKLVIESMAIDDRDDYYCVVTSVINETEHEGSKGTLVRVKGLFFFFFSVTSKFCHKKMICS